MTGKPDVLYGATKFPADGKLCMAYEQIIFKYIRNILKLVDAVSVVVYKWKGRLKFVLLCLQFRCDFFLFVWE